MGSLCGCLVLTTVFGTKQQLWSIIGNRLFKYIQPFNELYVMFGILIIFQTDIDVTSRTPKTTPSFECGSHNPIGECFTRHVSQHHREYIRIFQTGCWRKVQRPAILQSSALYVYLGNIKCFGCVENRSDTQSKRKPVGISEDTP